MLVRFRLMGKWLLWASLLSCCCTASGNVVLIGNNVTLSFSAIEANFGSYLLFPSPLISRIGFPPEMKRFGEFHFRMVLSMENYLDNVVMFGGYEKFFAMSSLFNFVTFEWNNLHISLFTRKGEILQRILTALFAAY